MTEGTATLAPPPATSAGTRPAWNVGWLTPFWCRVGLLALIAFAVVPRLFYLHSDHALGLAPDESQYWVWSRQLDWSYYSKGPMVAVLIRISTELFGDTMPAVRYPAMLIGVGMSLMTYWLTRKLFGSERLALAAVALTFFVPMFIAGSLVMTIDPPFVFFWAAATCLFVKAAVDGKRWAWPLAGLMVGLSFLAKAAALALFAGVFLGLILDPAFRRHLRSPWPYLAFLIAGLCTFPVFYWNHKNGWANAKHIKADTTTGFSWNEPLEFFGGTIGVLGPLLFVIVVAAVLHAIRHATESEPARRARFLALTVAPYVGYLLVAPFTTNAQLNWSAPIWFALLIVATWFLGTRFQDAALWKKWRGFVWGTVATGLVVMPLAHNVSVLYPVFEWYLTEVRGKRVRVFGDEAERAKLTPEQRRATEASVRRFDPTARLRGWEGFVKRLDGVRRETVGDDAFFLLDDYSEASIVAFYAPGNPKTYVMGPYIEVKERRGRSSQWDFWPDRSVERGKTTLIGRNAIYIGAPWKVLEASFEKVVPLDTIEVYQESWGTKYHIHGYRAYACYGFKGMVKPDDGKIAY